MNDLSRNWERFPRIIFQISRICIGDYSNVIYSLLLEYFFRILDDMLYLLRYFSSIDFINLKEFMEIFYIKFSLVHLLTYDLLNFKIICCIYFKKKFFFLINENYTCTTASAANINRNWKYCIFLKKLINFFNISSLLNIKTYYVNILDHNLLTYNLLQVIEK